VAELGSKLELLETEPLLLDLKLELNLELELKPLMSWT
jgi:hypothetical protein